MTNETLQNKSLVGEEMPHLQSLDGFFFMLSGEGKILFLSENVEKYLGFSQVGNISTPSRAANDQIIDGVHQIHREYTSNVAVQTTNCKCTLVTYQQHQQFLMCFLD